MRPGPDVGCVGSSEISLLPSFSPCREWRLFVCDQEDLVRMRFPFLDWSPNRIGESPLWQDSRGRTRRPVLLKTVCDRGHATGGVAWGLACIIAIATFHPAVQAQHAVEVLRYEPGTGFATEFGTGLGYTLTSAVLGEPSRVTPGMFGGPVDPFSPPYLREQLLSVGTGGMLEVRLDTPIRANPLNPFGIDFLVFGNQGKVIINGDYSGGGITDGTMFGSDGGRARVSVSGDGVRWFTLDEGLTPMLETLFPTDGAGDFTVPVDPSLTASDFNGLGLVEIRSLYAGSGGGTGFSLGWARDEMGVAAELDSASYIRFEVMSGRAEFDGVSVVRAVPEPGIGWLVGVGVLGLLGRPWRRAKIS